MGEYKKRPTQVPLDCDQGAITGQEGKDDPFNK